MNNGPRSRTHTQSRSLVCAACGKKLQKPNIIQPGLVESVQAEVFSGYNSEDVYYPNGLCSSCRRYLYKAKNGDVAPTEVRERWNSMDYASYRPPSRNTPCSCKICSVVRHRSDNLEENDLPDVPRKLAENNQA